MASTSIRFETKSEEKPAIQAMRVMLVDHDGCIVDTKSLKHARNEVLLAGIRASDIPNRNLFTSMKVSTLMEEFMGEDPSYPVTREGVLSALSEKSHPKNKKDVHRVEVIMPGDYGLGAPNLTFTTIKKIFPHPFLDMKQPDREQFVLDHKTEFAALGDQISDLDNGQIIKFFNRVLDKEFKDPEKTTLINFFANKDNERSLVDCLVYQSGQRGAPEFAASMIPVITGASPALQEQFNAFILEFRANQLPIFRNKGDMALAFLEQNKDKLLSVVYFDDSKPAIEAVQKVFNEYGQGDNLVTVFVDMAGPHEAIKYDEAFKREHKISLLNDLMILFNAQKNNLEKDILKLRGDLQAENSKDAGGLIRKELSNLQIKMGHYNFAMHAIQDYKKGRIDFETLGIMMQEAVREVAALPLKKKTTVMGLFKKEPTVFEQANKVLAVLKELDKQLAPPAPPRAGPVV